MALPELERWLQDRADRRPVAASIPMLDGYVAAIVAGPVSIDPLDWICPLLAVDGGWRTAGFAGEIIASVCERGVALAHPPVRITLPDAPAPTSKPLEAAYYATRTTLVDAARTLLRR